MSKKRALVTGASEGIGREFAMRLAHIGYEVTAVARNGARLQELKDKAFAIVPVVADLSVPADVERVATLLREQHFDLLINNAGFGHYGVFPKTNWKNWQDMLRVNIETLVQLSHAFLSKAQRGGALINVSSTLAFLPFPKSAVYAATKSFVTSFSESLWYEQKDRGVYVMSLCPGATRTEFHARAGGKSADISNKAFQTAGQVVDVAMAALKQRSQPTVISGAKNKIAAKVPRLLSRKMTVQLIGKAVR